MDMIPGPVCFTAQTIYQISQTFVGHQQPKPAQQKQKQQNQTGKCLKVHDEPEGDRLTVEVLIWEGPAIDGLATSAISGCEVSTCACMQVFSALVPSI